MMNASIALSDASGRPTHDSRRRQARRSRLAPDTPWRNLDERHEIADRIRQGDRIAIRPAAAEPPGKGGEGQRLPFELSASRREELTEVDTVDAPPKRDAAEHPLEHRLEDGPKRERIVRGQQMDRAALHRHRPHGTTVQHARRQAIRPETLDAAPETDVRGEWRL